MIIEAVTFTGNFGYSFFFRNVCRLWGERETERQRERKRRACCKNHHHILFVASKDWGRACCARRTHNHHHHQSINPLSLSLSPPPPHHDKNKERPVELTIFILTDLPRVRIGSHLVIHFVGSRGTHPEAWFGLWWCKVGISMMFPLDHGVDKQGAH